MASIASAVKCPHCGRSAIEDLYYKTYEKYIFCRRCGYNYSKTIKIWTDENMEFEEDIREGYGVFSLDKKEGQGKFVLLNAKLTADSIAKYQEQFLEKDVDQEKSYLVSFVDGLFTILFGNPPENFHLSFEEYKKKMIKKYSDRFEDIEYIVPIEE